VLIHGQFLREDQVDSLQGAERHPVALPDAHLLLGRLAPRPHGGPGAADNISPPAGCVRRGMIFSSHHDAPVAFPDSMRVLDATVTRRVAARATSSGPTSAST
jgi:predicted amidohydrolase YtcJ